MALQFGALHDALLSAGADQRIAQQAAEEAASYLKQIAYLDGQVRLLKWMAAVSSALAFICFALLLTRAG